MNILLAGFAGLVSPHDEHLDILTFPSPICSSFLVALDTTSCVLHVQVLSAKTTIPSPGREPVVTPNLDSHH